MTYTPTDLILRGNVTINSVDVTDEVTGVHINGTANDVVIPATMGTPKSHAPGSTKYTVQFDYLSDDSSTSATLFGILWEAVDSDTKELDWTARLRTGDQSADNPEWSGTLVVSAADVGGQAEDLSSGSLTCTLTGEPVINEA